MATRFASVLLSAGLAAGCAGEPAPSTERGGLSFRNYCAPCHLPDGRGVEGGGPPLAGSAWIRGPESRLIRIVLNGVRGPIDVGGATYDREMLAFGPILSDEEIAALLTFVRHRFGASGPVTPPSVRRTREATRDRTEYWTADELLRIP